MHWHEATKELRAKDLDNEDDEPDDHEGGICGHTVQYIYLVINFSWANHVENLHEDEQVEDDWEVARGRCLLERLVNGSLLHVLLHAH